MDSEDEPVKRQQTADLDTSSQVPGVDTLDHLHQAEKNRSKRRVATVYDAVAGEALLRHTLSRESRC